MNKARFPVVFPVNSFKSFEHRMKGLKRCR